MYAAMSVLTVLATLFAVSSFGCRCATAPNVYTSTHRANDAFFAQPISAPFAVGRYRAINVTVSGTAFKGALLSGARVQVRTGDSAMCGVTLETFGKQLSLFFGTFDATSSTMQILSCDRNMPVASLSAAEYAFLGATLNPATGRCFAVRVERAGQCCAHCACLRRVRIRSTVSSTRAPQHLALWTARIARAIIAAVAMHGGGLTAIWCAPTCRRCTKSAPNPRDMRRVSCNRQVSRESRLRETRPRRQLREGCASRGFGLLRYCLATACSVGWIGPRMQQVRALRFVLRAR